MKNSAKKILILSLLILLSILSVVSYLSYLKYQNYAEHRWEGIIEEKESEGWVKSEVYGTPGKFRDWYFFRVKQGMTVSYNIYTCGYLEKIVNIAPEPPKQEALMAVFLKEGRDSFVVVLR